MFIVESVKEVSQILPNLSFLDLGSLMTAIGESICQCQSLEKSLEEWNIYIEGITDDGCGLLPGFRDISDDLELIALASLCTAHLMQAYRCI